MLPIAFALAVLAFKARPGRWRPIEHRRRRVRRRRARCRAAWHGEQTALAVLVGLAAALPWFGPGWVHIDVLAAWLYLALSATGLALTAGLAGLPSLAQGAFMSVGSFATALLVARAGWSASATIPVAVAVALLLSLTCGVVLVRLPPLYLAVSTWLVAWLILLVATEFPGVAGGSQGYTVPSDLSATGHYELALALTVLAVAGLSVLRRTRIGVSLRAIRDRPAAARTLGVRSGRLLLGAFVASAAVGGLAGSLAVQLAGVSDPNAFGPFTSFELLVAILLGGASYASAGVVGVGVLGAIALLGHAWAGLQNGAPAQLQPMLASTILLAILALGGDGVIPFLLRYRPGRERGLPAPAPAASRSSPPPPSSPPAGSGSRTAACTRWPVSTWTLRRAKRLRSSARTAPGRPRRCGRLPVRWRWTRARSRSTEGRSRGWSRRCSPRPASSARSSRRPRSRR